MFKKLCAVGYRIALAVLALHAVYTYATGGWSAAFHGTAYYIPIAAMFLMFSGQADLLEAIRKGGDVSIKARAIDFVHWFLLTFMVVGRWMMGGITVWAFILNTALLAIIGWQVGAGIIGRKWYPSIGEKRGGIAMLVIAAGLGLIAGAVRHSDASTFGWGWMLETITAIISTMIVVWWISMDIKTISKKASDYPRSFFLKGVFNNALALLVFAHLITSYQGGAEESFASNAGFAFNAIVGNAIYLAYYFVWEYHQYKQTRQTH